MVFRKEDCYNKLILLFTDGEREMGNVKKYIRHPIELAVVVEALITIHYFEYTKDYQYPGESHDFWEIMYLDRGSAYVTCGGREHLLEQGELILLPPNAFHRIRADAVHPSNVFIISFTAESGLLPEIGGKVLSLSSDGKKLIHSIVREGGESFQLPMADRCCLVEQEGAPVGGQQLIRLRLEELLIRLLRKVAAQSARERPDAVRSKSRYDHQIADKVRGLLSEHLHDAITIEEITASLGYGKTYLSAVFKRVYGTSIMNYYTGLKIDEAKYLIRDNTLSVTEISELLGFSSPQYFSKRFRQFVHMSPKQYERSVKAAWSAVITE